jgi:two-component system chemotaxis response regulator CheB
LKADVLSEVDRGASDSPQPGESSGLTCPECQGGLWVTDEGGFRRYRCRVGHEYAEEAFTVAQAERVETALWTALRALEERAAVHRRMAARQQENGLADLAARSARRAERSVEDALVLRTLLAEGRDEDVA